MRAAYTKIEEMKGPGNVIYFFCIFCFDHGTGTGTALNESYKNEVLGTLYTMA